MVQDPEGRLKVAQTIPAVISVKVWRESGLKDGQLVRGSELRIVDWSLRRSPDVLVIKELAR